MGLYFVMAAKVLAVGSEIAKRTSNERRIRMVRASWSMKEFQQALRMKRRGATCADIADALGRTTTAVEAKFKYCGKAVTSSMALSPEGPTSAIKEQINQDATRHRDLTSVICGDPPAGYSALDRRGGKSPTASGAPCKNGPAPASQYACNEGARDLQVTRFANTRAISTHTLKG
jgi:hypothetical protein